MTFSERDLNALAGLFSLAGRLKRLKRQGWIDRGVDQPESVADHSWRLALMALVMASRDPDLDAGRAVHLALIHDLPECLAGDVTPFDERLSDPEADQEALFHDLPEYSQEADQTKTAAERQAMRDLTTDLPDDLRDRLMDSWEEYETGNTPESRLVRQLDKLETWLQALEYREMQPDLIIESFRKGTGRDVTDPEIVALLHVVSERWAST